MHITEITITGPIRNKGSNMITWNVDVSGRPFGRIYTFKARGETHGYHAIVGATENHTIADTYEAAETWLRGQI